MAKATKKVAAAAPVTRAEKKDAVKNLIKEILNKKSYKHNDLIDQAAKLYTEKFGGEETENVNDVKGRVGSVLDIMKKDDDVAFDGGMYALKQETVPAPAPEKAEKKPAKRTTKKKTEQEKPEEKVEEIQKTEMVETAKETAQEDKPKTKRTTTKKTTAKKEKKAEIKEEIKPLPPAPLQPIAPTAPTTPETAPLPEKTEEKPAPKKRTRQAKTEIKTDEKPEEKPAKAAVEETPVVEIQNPPVVKEKAEIVKKDVVDMSFLFGGAAKAETKPQQKPETKAETKPQKPVEIKTEAKVEQKAESKPESKMETQSAQRQNVRKLPTDKKVIRKITPTRPMSADEKLRENFLRRMRQLGGEYFEYYSVYLLERYSMKNGRRLESMRIIGGDKDGGVDGEIELTDKLGFKETIYIQSKNWDPDKGDERLWVVGETLLQQFIGACVCRQAKDCKQNARGIFVTTSRFTPDAKRILETMSDKIIGYDGADVYEAAKECQFGLIYENGNWKIDEKLLSSPKAFFNML